MTKTIKSNNNDEIDSQSSENLKSEESATSNQKQESEIQEIDPVENFTEFLTTNSDAQEYLTLCTITGKKVSPELMGEYEIKSWIADMQEWVAQDKPKPKMPKMKRGIVKFATAIYRIRDAGKDKIYAYFNDESVSGFKEITEYEQVENITTGELEDSKIIKNKFNAYTEEFTISKCEKLIRESENLMRPGQSIQLYFWFNGAKKPISPQNIMLSYEDIAGMIRERKPLN